VSFTVRARRTGRGFHGTCQQALNHRTLRDVVGTCCGGRGFDCETVEETGELISSLSSEQAKGGGYPPLGDCSIALSGGVLGAEPSLVFEEKLLG
jgi:hypothetical protein